MAPVQKCVMSQMGSWANSASLPTSIRGSMAIPLLAAKTYLPRPISGRVERVRLRERLDQALSTQRKLVLVSALAGSGKSTLLADWAATSAIPCAWFSLDAQDNHPALFWAYLIRVHFI